MTDLFVFSALLMTAGAAWTDLRRTRVDNAWLLLWLTVSLAIRLRGPGPPAIQTGLSGLLLPVLLLFPFFYFRMLGAGDIKTLAVLGSMMGPGTVLKALFWTFLIGAVLSVLTFLIYGGFRERVSYFLTYVKQYFQTGQRTPYLRAGVQAESLHMTVPVFLAALLWAGGAY